MFIWISQTESVRKNREMSGPRKKAALFRRAGDAHGTGRLRSSKCSWHQMRKCSGYLKIRLFRTLNKKQMKLI